MEAPRTTDAGTGQDAFLAQAHGGGASPTSRSPCWHAAWNGSGCLIYSTLHRAPLSAAHAHPCWEPGVRKDERMAPASRGGTGSRGSETRPRCTRSRPPTGCCRSRAASPRSAGAMAPCRLSQSRGANLGIAGTIHCEFAVRRGGIYEGTDLYSWLLASTKTQPPWFAHAKWAARARWTGSQTAESPSRCLLRTRAQQCQLV